MPPADDLGSVIAVRGGWLIDMGCMGAVVEFQVLGQVAVARDGDVVRPAGLLARTLLSVLLSRYDAPVSVDVLTEALWPNEHDDRAARKLQVQVSRLRSVVGGRDRLLFEQHTYRLRILPDELDAARFLTMVDEAAEVAGTDPARCVELTRKALTLWRGEPYAGIDTPAVLNDVTRLRERRLAALVTLYRAELSLGRHATVLSEIAEFAAAHPLHERAQWLLITGLDLSGRRAEALAVYRGVRRRLMDELAIGPGPELREQVRRLVVAQRMHESAPRPLTSTLQ